MSSTPGHCCVVKQTKAVQFGGIDQGSVTLCSSDSSHRPGVALAVHPILSGIPIYRLNGS